MIKHHTWLSAVAASVTLLSACSESAVVQPDAGATTMDATSANDTGVLADAGTRPDATPGADAVVTDVGTNPDAGVLPMDIDVNADITGDTTWVSGSRITLKQHIFVTGGTLTIEPGVTVLGESGSSLVVTQNAKLNAVGTIQRPIVFTSAKAAELRAPGDWGGVVMLGKAPINVMGGTEKVEGFPATETRTIYGGTEAAHDCGKLKYARIEFAGFELAPDNELNSLTIGACGSATEIEYIETYRGSDDGVEIFGGTVNIKHILIVQPDDDGLDWDFGWSGKAQFVIVQQNRAVGNYGFEADNNRNSPNATPRSMPEIWNATLLGSDAEPGNAGKTQGGMLLRRGTAAKINNSIVTHFTDQAIDVDGQPSVDQANAGNLFVKSSIFFDNANLSDQFPAETDNDMGFDEGAFFRDASRANRFVDPMISAGLNLQVPVFKPAAGSPALTGGATPPADGFFDATATYVGAIGADDWTVGWTWFGAAPPAPIDVNADIAADTTWRTGQVVTLKQHIFVTGGTLTIEPGATILGDSGSSLVVSQNGKLNAVGTKEQPIVFTSAKPEGTRAPGDWGGVVMLGKAPINVMSGTEKVEGFPATETRTIYGGMDALHDCGKLKYARIEFAGFELAPDNELNSLTIGACGSATEIDYIETYKGSDDGVEIFGGTVNIKHILIVQPDDDGLDWDFGWSGKAQFVIVQQNAQVGNYGFEADNNRNSANATPRSMPEIWNATLLGSNADPGMAGKSQGGMLLRRGTAAKINNAIVTHFADFTVDVDGQPSVDQATAGNLFVRTSIFFDNANLNDRWPMETDNDMGFDEGAFFAGAALANRFVDPLIDAAMNLLGPNFKPAAGSPALMGGGTPPADGFFDASATFVGAVGSTDWTKVWTAFPR